MQPVHEEPKNKTKQAKKTKSSPTPNFPWQRRQGSIDLPKAQSSPLTMLKERAMEYVYTYIHRMEYSNHCRFNYGPGFQLFS